MNCTSKIGHNFGGAVFLCQTIIKKLRIDMYPFSWTDIIKLLFGNEFGILPDSFLLT